MSSAQQFFLIIMIILTIFFLNAKSAPNRSKYSIAIFLLVTFILVSSITFIIL